MTITIGDLRIHLHPTECTNCADPLTPGQGTPTPNGTHCHTRTITRQPTPPTPHTP